MSKAFPHVAARLIVLAMCVVTLLAACMVGPGAVEQPTEVAAASPTPAAPTDAGTPSVPPVATTETPIATPTAGPTPSPAPTPTPVIFLPWGSPLPPTILPATPPPSLPPATAEPTPSELVAVKTGNARPTRIVIEKLGIDLAVVKGNSAYPLCNVAQWMEGFVNPGHAGTTYIYGHARTGMFLPLLDRSKINSGASMIGMLVKVYTADKKLHLYRINIVKRHAVDLSLAYDLDAGQHRLIMQTSEGPHGTVQKLQVAAKPIGVYAATAAQALPTPHPKVCGT